MKLAKKLCRSALSRGVGLAIFSLSIAPLGIAAETAQLHKLKFDPQPWIEDFSFLKRGLEANYANLLWFASPESGKDLPSLNQRTVSLLETAKSDADAENALRSFVQRFGDAHFKQLPTLPLKDAASPEPDRRNLEGLSPDQACAAIADGATADPAFSVPFESMGGFTLIGNGWDQPFRYGMYVTADKKKIAVLRIQSFREIDYRKVCTNVWEDFRQAKMDISYRNVRAELPHAWVASLAQVLRSLKALEPDALLVDIGGNGGGNDSGDWATRLFTEKAVNSPALLVGAANAGAYIDAQLSNFHRSNEVAPVSRPDLRAVADYAIKQYEQRKTSLSNPRCDMAWAWREQKVWDPARCGALVPVGFSGGAVSTLAKVEKNLIDYTTYIYWPAIADPHRGAWSGKVYVLTDNRAGSSAEMFAAIMQDNAIAKIVGTATRGAGCGNMRKIKPIVLPRSRLRFQVPDCVRLRRDGSDEVAGIRADIDIEALPNESARAKTHRAMQSIDRDLSEQR